MSIGKDFSGPLKAKILHNFDKTAATHVQFSGDGKYIASGDAQGNVSIWDVEKGSLVKKVKQHEKGVSSLCWDNKDSVISSSDGGDVKVWSVSAAKQLQNLKFDAPKSGPVHAVGFIPLGNHIIAGGDKGLINIWNAKTGALEKSTTVFPTGDAAVTDIQVSPTGKYVTLCNGSSLLIMDPKTLNIIFDKFTRNLNEFNNSQKLGDPFFIYDDRVMVTTANGLTLWDLRSGRKMNDLGPSLPVKGVYAGTQWGVACAVGSKPELVQMETGNHRPIENSDPEALTAVSAADMDANGKVLAVAGEKGVQVWGFGGG